MPLPGPAAPGHKTDISGVRRLDGRIVQDCEERIADGLAGVVELHQDVTNVSGDRPMLGAGHLLADALRERHQVVGNRRAVVAEAEPSREALTTAEAETAASCASGQRGREHVRGDGGTRRAGLQVLIIGEPELAEVLVVPARDGRLDEVRLTLRELEVEALPFPADTAVKLARLRSETGLKMLDCCVLLAAEHVGTRLRRSTTGSGRLPASEACRPWPPDGR